MRMVIAVAAGALLLGACSPSTLDTESLNDQISTELEERFEVEAEVTCPDDIEIEDGGEFECTAEDTQGNSHPVTVVQTDASGNVNWTMNIFNLPVIEQEIAPDVSQSVNAEITIACPRILVSSEEGSSMDCDATDEMGREGILRITSIDDEGNVSWELNP